MKMRLVVALLSVSLVVACAPESTPEPAETEAAAPAMDDQAAVDAVRVAYVERHNAGDVEGLAALFSDDAVTLFADGGVSMGRGAIQASLADTMAGNPTAQIDAAETLVFGDRAVQRGSYHIDMSPEGGEPVAFGGHYMTAFGRTADGWKIDFVISNYDGPPPAGLPAGTRPAEAAEGLADNPLADFVASYADHFNQGHAAVVAGMYTEDAVAAFADAPLATGRDAIEAGLQQRIDAGSQLAIHTVGVQDLGDGWMLAGGWYEATVDGATRPGSWAILVRTAEDGSHQIHWSVTNAVHDGM